MSEIRTLILVPGVSNPNCLKTRLKSFAFRQTLGIEFTTFETGHYVPFVKKRLKIGFQLWQRFNAEYSDAPKSEHVRISDR